MEVFHVRAFVAASRERTVARAAQSLSVTPSPVSRALREFERSVGGPVFVRAYHELRLTDLGTAALPAAVELLAHLDRLERLAAGPRPLRIGATPWARPTYLDELLKAAAEPGPPAEVTQDVSAGLLHLLRHGALDLAVVHLPVELPDVGTRPLAHYEFSVVVRAGDPLAGRGSIRLADLAGRDVLMMPTSMQPTPMGTLWQRVQDAGPGSLTEVPLADLAGTRATVRHAGAVLLGTAAGGAPGAQGQGDGLTTVPVEDDLDFWVGLAWRTGMAVDRERVDALVASIHPLPGEPLDVIR